MQCYQYAYQIKLANRFNIGVDGGTAWAVIRIKPGICADSKASLYRCMAANFIQPRMPRANSMGAIMGELPVDAATALSRSALGSVLDSMMPTLPSRCVCSMRMSSENHAVVKIKGVVLGVPSVYAV